MKRIATTGGSSQSNEKPKQHTNETTHTYNSTHNYGIEYLCDRRVGSAFQVSRLFDSYCDLMTAEERAAQIVAGVGQDAHHRRSELETKPNARRSVESGTNFPTTNQPTTTMTQEEIIQKQADRLPQGYSLFCWVYNARPSDLGWGVKDLTTGQRIVKSQNTAKQAVDRALPIITNNHNNN